MGLRWEFGVGVRRLVFEDAEREVARARIKVIGGRPVAFAFLAVALRAALAIDAPDRVGIGRLGGVGFDVGGVLFRPFLWRLAGFSSHDRGSCPV